MELNDNEIMRERRWNSLSHDLTVVYCVPYVDVRLERGCSHSGIEIQNIGRLVARGEVRVYSVDEGGFTRTCHANGDYHYRLFLVFLLLHRRSRQDVVCDLFDIFVRSAA